MRLHPDECARHLLQRDAADCLRPDARSRGNPGGGAGQLPSTKRGAAVAGVDPGLDSRSGRQARRHQGDAADRGNGPASPGPILDSRSPLAATAAALQRAVSNSAQDVAFVPGKTDFDRAMALLLQRRPSTTLLADPLMTRSRRFCGRWRRTRDRRTDPRPDGLEPYPRHVRGPGGSRARAQHRCGAGGAPALPLDANGHALNARFMVRGCRIG